MVAEPAAAPLTLCWLGCGVGVHLTLPPLPCVLRLGVQLRYLGSWGCGLRPFHILPSLSVLMHPPADVLLVGSFRRLCAKQRNLCWVINVLLDVD